MVKAVAPRCDDGIVTPNCPLRFCRKSIDVAAAAAHDALDGSDVEMFLGDVDRDRFTERSGVIAGVAGFHGMSETEGKKPRAVIDVGHADRWFHRDGIG